MGCQELMDTFLSDWCKPLSRFTAEEKAKRPQLCYMPFGHGPRSCIGMRFAMLEAKLALLELMRRFSFVRTPDTQVKNEGEGKAC